MRRTDRHTEAANHKKTVKAELETIEFMIENYNNCIRSRKRRTSDIKSVVHAVRDLIFCLTGLEKDTLKVVSSRYKIGNEAEPLVFESERKIEISTPGNETSEMEKMVSSLFFDYGMTVSKRIFSLEIVRSK